MNDRTELRLLRAEDYVTKPWKNGQGVTRDVLLWPASDDFDIRVSLADIPPASTFSAFPGITRHITRLSGDAMTLTFADGEEKRLPLMTPLTFDSGKAPACKASGGDVRVLNVMTRAASWRSSVKPLSEGRHRIMPPAKGVLLVFAVTGPWTVETGGSAVQCASYETLLARGPAGISLTGAPGARALVASLEPAASDGSAAFGFFESIRRN